MQNDFLSIVAARQSVRGFDPEVEIPRDELNKIIEVTTKAPSAWNLQHWKFLVFNDQEAKEKLLPIAYHQQQVKDASAVIAVLGDLEAYKNVEAVYGEQVKAGHMPEEAKDTLAVNINNAYENVPNFGRDEAIKNASLAAMQLMLTAKAFGYDSGPMGGFDPQGLKVEFNVPDRYLPILLISIGKRTKDAHTTTRFSADEVTVWNKF